MQRFESSGSSNQVYCDNRNLLSQTSSPSRFARQGTMGCSESSYGNQDSDSIQRGTQFTAARLARLGEVGQSCIVQLGRIARCGTPTVLRGIPGHVRITTLRRDHVGAWLVQPRRLCRNFRLIHSPHDHMIISVRRVTNSCTARSICLGVDDL